MSIVRYVAWFQFIIIFVSFCSDEEEDYSPIERSHGNWTDQVTISSTSSRHSEPRDNFDGPVQQYVGSSGNRNIKVKPTSHDNLSFLDDEDQRRTKKNEEVLKNIERARRRRAEEEQKYRVVDDFGGRRSPSQYNDYHSGSSGKRSNDVRRPSPGSYENGVSKSVPNNASFGKFDVGGQTESDDYDSEPKRNDHSSAVHGGNRGNKQNSVPPRFKRQGGGGGDQLHNYKRSSPPKDRNQHFSGDADISADVRSSASRESAESQSQDKDYGSMFRQQSSNSGGGMPPSSGWGMRSHQHEGSSDRDDVASRFDEGSASEQRPSSQEESKRLNHATINENDDEVGGGAGSGGGGNFARGSGGRTSNRSGKGRSDKHDDTKHKASNKTSDSTKERNQGKRDSNIQNKSDRGQRNNQRGGGHNNASGRNNDGKKSNDQKGQSNSRNQRSGSNKKDDEFEDNKFSQRQLSSSSARQDLAEDDSMSMQPAPAPAKESSETFDSHVGETPDNSGGWFAPRGQPSRRGRGGLASGTGGRQSNHRSGNAHDNELDDHHGKHNKAANRRSQQLNDDWDESSSERSAGQNEDHRRDGNRRGGGGGGDNRSHGGRKDRSKKQGKSGSNDHGDDKRGGANKHDNEDIEAAASNRNKRGDRNNRGDRKHDDKDIKRSGGSGGQSDRRNNDRDSKQIAFERRQNKLPPRLAKQKEQNRQSGGQMQPQSVTEAWGSQNNDIDGNASNNMPPPVGGGVQWDPSVINQYGLAGLQHQPQQQQSQSSLSVGMDFENNRALLIQRLRSTEDGVMSIGADSGMRLDATGLAVGSGASNVGLASNMTEAFTPESRENAVQTIIFENTNFKGPRPMVGNAGNAGENEKMMFKLGGGGQDKNLVGGFNQSAKGEDDLKLDFTFETADIPGSGEVGKDGQGSGGVSAHRPVSSSSVATAVVSSSQPATADDLNMKIASVKKVWETLPSMSPVPGGGVGGEQPSTIGPFSANEDKAFDPPSNGYDKDTATTAAANMAKMRPNQQNNQVPSHHPPNSQAAHGQQQVQNQPIPHSVHSQLQQPSNQLHHQSLLQPQQQASLDDRVLGRGNGANMAYNRLLGTGALPNLQSPPSILGQQPSLYQAFQIDPNRGVTNQLYPYAAATGIGGQSLILPPSGSSLSAAGSSATNTADLFGTSSNSQFRNQFAAPPPSGTQTSTVMSGLMSQSSLMTSSMKPATANIGPIGTKAGQLGGHNAYQQGGIGSLPASATSPLIIPYDGSFVPRSGQTAFYQALASQQTTRQNNFGITGFPNQQSLIQQQMMRNQVPPQIPPTYMKPDSGKQGGNNQQRSSDPYNGNNVGLGGLQGRQFNSGSTGQHQQPAIKATATSLASMSLRGSVLGTNANTNGTVSTSAQAVQQTASYSPTPIRPPGGKGTFIH